MLLVELLDVDQTAVSPNGSECGGHASGAASERILLGTEATLFQISTRLQLRISSKPSHGLDGNPFLRLLVRSYVEATAEDHARIALLRAWTVLELLAERAIPKGQPISPPDGSPIVNARGNRKDTNAKEGRFPHIHGEAAERTASTTSATPAAARPCSSTPISIECSSEAVLTLDEPRYADVRSQSTAFA
jgi:hypothetical protein